MFRTLRTTGWAVIVALGGVLVIGTPGSKGDDGERRNRRGDERAIRHDARPERGVRERHQARARFRRRDGSERRPKLVQRSQAGSF